MPANNAATTRSDTDYLDALWPKRKVEEHWNSLLPEEQEEIFEEFLIACIDGSKEPSEYWYPVLMPTAIKGYVGD